MRRLVQDGTFLRCLSILLPGLLPDICLQLASDLFKKEAAADVIHFPQLLGVKSNFKQLSSFEGSYNRVELPVYLSAVQKIIWSS